MVNLNIINSKKKRKFGILYSLFFLFLLIIVLVTAKAYAENLNLVNWYINNKKITEEQSIFTTALRGISWGITSLLAYLADAAESLYNSAFDFIDITTYRTVQLFIEDFKPIIIGIVAISLFALFLMIILGSEKRPKFMQNFIILILVVSASTLCFNEMNSLVKTFKASVEKYKVSDSSSLTYSAINSNLIDLVKLSSKKKGLDKVNYKHASKEELASYFGAGIKNNHDFSLIDYTSTLNPDSAIFNYAKEGNTKEILNNKLITKDIDRKDYTTKKVDNGWGWNTDDASDFGNEFYYRYYQNTINTWLNLFAIIFLYLTMAYKVVRLAYEIVMSRILVIPYAADFSGGEKQKKILIVIRDTYIMFAVVILSVKLYQIIATYCNTHYIDFKQGAFTLIAAFIVVDGPNVVEKILGMDAGLKSSTARLLAVGSTAGFLARKGKNFTKGAVSGTKKIFGNGKRAYENSKANSEKYKNLSKEKGARENMSNSSATGSSTNSQDNSAGDKSSPREYESDSVSNSHQAPGRDTNSSNQASFKNKTSPKQTKARSDFENSIKKRNKDSFNNQNRFNKNIKSTTKFDNSKNVKNERRDISDKTNRKH